MSVRRKGIVSINPRDDNLKRRLRRHLKILGFTRDGSGALQIEDAGKETIRNLHKHQKEERLEASRKLISQNSEALIEFFAQGSEINPEQISPVLERVQPNTLGSDLFRFASLTWSVPVSNGFGRRIRYLVRDDYNGKLIGLIAIGDPVFNLAARDKLIGWNSNDRRERLVNIMDAYVLGAVPPYNKLLGGKLLACLLRSRKIYNDFTRTYGNTTGLISKKQKKARLLAITTSSSMGRSSVYNRLKLNGTPYLKSIGYTGGWGHFHIPDKLFNDLRNYLREIGHPYADHYKYGQGPNWRLRTTRAALSELGIKQDILRHGIQREVFICELAANAAEILRTGKGRPVISSLLSAEEITGLALERWVIPRSVRMPEYQNWTLSDTADLFGRQKRAVLTGIEKLTVCGY